MRLMHMQCTVVAARTVSGSIFLGALGLASGGARHQAAKETRSSGNSCLSWIDWLFCGRN